MSQPLLCLTLLLLACGGGISKSGGPDSPSADDDDDGTPNDEDCAPQNPAVNPDQTEVCDGLDNDCNGKVDEYDEAVEGTVFLYPDNDGDGWGQEANGRLQCEATAGWVERPGDCDDDDAGTFPEALEDCGTPNDDNCDGEVNTEGALSCANFYEDADGDTIGGGDPRCLCFSEGVYTEGEGGDCDDSDDAISPLAAEVCGDGIDQDCDSDPTDCRFDEALDATAADLRVWSTVANAATGDHLVTGELTGAGGDDLLVTAQGSEGTSAYLLDGSAMGTYAFDAGQIAFSGLGDLRPSSPGDVDGDGLLDLAIGQPATGQVFLFAGPLSGRRTAAEAEATYVGLSSDLAGAATLLADLDGDALSELVVGLPFRGELRVLRPGAAFDLSSAGVRVRSSGDGGTVLFDPGDVDGDGLGDLLVAGPTSRGGGEVWLLPGPLSTDTTANASALLHVEGAVSGDGLGTALGAADWDGDGTPDLLLGAPGDSTDTTEGGRVSVLSGALRGDQSPSAAMATFAGEGARDRAGDALSAAGDLDGDGAPDLLVAAPDHDHGGSNAGAVALFYGPSTGALTFGDAHALLIGENGGDRLGAAVSLGADLNHDGQPDLLLTAPGLDRGASGAGGVYGFWGLGY